MQNGISGQPDNRTAIVLAFIKADVAKRKEDYSYETSTNLLHITHLRGRVFKGYFEAFFFKAPL